MNAKELYSYIGQRGSVELGGLNIYVEITDAKVAWGNNRFLIVPLSGSGTVWVDAARVQIDKDFSLVVGPTA